MNLESDFEYLELEARLKRELELSRLSVSSEPILILAELGLEKILIAKYIHSISDYQASRFTAIRCSQKKMNDHLSQISFHQLEYSTLFIDHAELLSPEEEDFLIKKMKQHNFKLIFSTHSRFKEKIQERIPSKNWFFPPLRERKLDVLSLANQMGHHFFNWNGKDFLGFDMDAKRALEEYPWPGNTLELSLCIQKASLFHEIKAPLNQLSLELPARMLRFSKQQVPSASAPLQVVRLGNGSGQTQETEHLAPVEDEMSYTDLKRKWSDAFEKDYLTRILLKNQGNVSAAARESKIDRSNFLRLLRRHAIKSDEYRKDAKQAA